MLIIAQFIQHKQRNKNKRSDTNSKPESIDDCKKWLFFNVSKSDMEVVSEHVFFVKLRASSYEPRACLPHPPSPSPSPFQEKERCFNTILNILSSTSAVILNTAEALAVTLELLVHTLNY